MDINTERSPLRFADHLIKGKIAENVFEHMFRSVEEFILLPFGYENTIPELAQQRRRMNLTADKVISDLISHSPDFVLVSKKENHKGVYLVEVKYRSRFNSEEIKKLAQEIHEKWHIVWLFLATPDGFYFDSCKNIIDIGNIKKLSEDWIPQNRQDDFLKLLKKYEK